MHGYRKHGCDHDYLCPCRRQVAGNAVKLGGLCVDPARSDVAENPVGLVICTKTIKRMISGHFSQRPCNFLHACRTYAFLIPQGIGEYDCVPLTNRT